MKRMTFALEKADDDLDELVESFCNIGLSNIKLPNLPYGWPFDRDLTPLDPIIGSISLAYFQGPPIFFEISKSISSNVHALKSNFWDALIQKNIEPIVIAILMYKFMETQNDSSLGLDAACLYITLLGLSGATHHIFNAIIIAEVTKLVNKWVFDIINIKNDINDEKSLEDNFNANGNKTIKNTSNDDYISNTENYEKIYFLLDSMKKVTHSVCLEVKSDAYMNILNMAIHLLKIVGPYKQQNKDHFTTFVENLKTYSVQIIEGLSLEIHDNENKPQVAFSIISKSILPILLCSHNDCNNTNHVQKFLHNLSKSALNMIFSMAKNHTHFEIIYVLFQHLCVQVSNTVENRKFVNKLVNEIFLFFFNRRLYLLIEKMLEFLISYGNNKKPFYRLFAIEVAEEIIISYYTAIDSEEHDDSSNGDAIQVDCLINFIFGRVNDKIILNRSKALSSMSILINYVLNMNDSITKCKFMNALKNCFFNNDSNKRVLEIIRNRLKEGRSSISKASLQLLESMIKFEGLKDYSYSDIRLFRIFSFDTSLTVRKQSITSISSLLEFFPTSKIISTYWMTSVPVLIMDSENTIQEAVAKIFLNLIDNMENNTNIKKSIVINYNPLAISVLEQIGANGNELFAFSLLKIIEFLTDSSRSDECRIDSKRCKTLVLSLLVWSKDANLTRNARIGAWNMLYYLSILKPQSFDLKVLLNNWGIYKNDPAILTKILLIIANMGKDSSDEAIKYVENDVLAILDSFSADSKVINAAMEVLSNSNTFSKSSNELMRICEKFLSKIIEDSDRNNSRQSEMNNNDTMNFQYLNAIIFTLGELTLRRKNKKFTSGHVVTLMQTLISSKFNFICCYNSELEKEIVGRVNNTVRNNAFITLGKLSLVNDQIVKDCTPLFLNELENTKCPIIKNNIIVIMCDMIVRYPNLIDRYIGKISMFLYDEDELVKKQTLILITQLLRGDYVKLKQKNLFFHFLGGLADEKENLRKFYLICLKSIVFKIGDGNTNGSDVFFSNFIETIFVLNDYRLHPKYNQMKFSERERALFSLSGGGENRKKRFTIYKTFFDNMLDDQKFQLSFKLCSEILQGFTDGIISLNNAQNLLYDTLCILSSQEIKMKYVKGKANQLDMEEEGNSTNEVAQMKLNEAKKILLSQIIKKNILENIVPTVIELREILTRSHSPLLKHINDYLLSLVVEFKDEMKQILSKTPRLAAELEYKLTHLSSTCNNDLDPIDFDGHFSKNLKSIKPKKLESAASAPTPWRPKGPRTNEFSIPKLNINSKQPYVPSPARVSFPAQKLMGNDTESVNKSMGTVNSFDGNPASLHVYRRQTQIIPNSPTIAKLRQSSSSMRSIINCTLNSPSAIESTRIELANNENLDLDSHNPSPYKRVLRAKALSKKKKSNVKIFLHTDDGNDSITKNKKTKRVIQENSTRSENTKNLKKKRNRLRHHNSSASPSKPVKKKFK